MFDWPLSPPEASCEQEHAWPDDGLRWVAEPRRCAPGLNSLLTWAFQEKASRIAFQTGHPVWVSIHGRNYRVTRGAVDEYELSQIVNHLYGADGMARLQGGNDFDTAYAIPIDRSTRLRFRLNATPRGPRGATAVTSCCGRFRICRRRSRSSSSSQPSLMLVVRVRAW